MMRPVVALGSVKTSHFSSAELSANERKQCILLIYTEFGTRKVRRLNRA